MSKPGAAIAGCAVGTVIGFLAAAHVIARAVEEVMAHYEQRRVRRAAADSRMPSSFASQSQPR